MWKRRLARQFGLVDLVERIKQLAVGVLQSLYFQHLKLPADLERIFYFVFDLPNSVGEFAAHGDALFFNIFVIDVVYELGLWINTEQHGRLYY